MDETKTQEMTQDNGWLKEEVENTAKQNDFEELPSLKLQPNIITEITVDFSNPFQVWEGEQGGKQIVKKIIPITFGETKMNWWLNVKNPIYHEIVEAGIEGQTKFKVLQTGTQADTKYVSVK